MPRRRRLYRFWRQLQHSRLLQLLVVLTVFFLTGFVVVTTTSVAEIRAVQVEGTHALDAEDVRRVAEEALKAPLLFHRLIPGNLVLFRNRNAVAALTTQFPRIAEVTLSGDLETHTVTVVLRERQTAFIYCDAREETLSTSESETRDSALVLTADQIGEGELAHFAPLVSEGCFLADAHAVIFAVAPETEGTVIMTVLDAEGTAVPLGQVALPPDTLAALQLIWETFRSSVQVSARHVFRRPGGIVTVETFEGWEAVFSLDPNYPVAAQTTALRELLAKELEPAERRGISLIDLRIPGRIYYR